MIFLKKIVIYETTYGSTESYAKRIAEELGATIKKHEQIQVEKLADYDLVIIGTCLLSGKIYDTDRIEQWINTYPDKTWGLFTVGLSNPSLTDFEPIFKANFSEVVQKRITPFHFRGTIRYKRLNLMYGLLDKAHINRQSSIDTVPLDDEGLNLLKTYGTIIDSRDADSIKPLIEWVEASEEQFKQS